MSRLSILLAAFRFVCQEVHLGRNLAARTLLTKRCTASTVFSFNNNIAVRPGCVNICEILHAVLCGTKVAAVTNILIRLQHQEQPKALHRHYCLQTGLVCIALVLRQQAAFHVVLSASNSIPALPFGSWMALKDLPDKVLRQAICCVCHVRRFPQQCQHGGFLPFSSQLLPILRNANSEDLLPATTSLVFGLTPH